MGKSKQHSRTILFALLGMTGVLGAGGAQAEISRGEIIASTCYTCHGTYGVSTGSIPSLHELSAERLTSMMQEYRAGTRISTVMGRHASGYTDEEIVELAKYIGKRRQ